MRSTMMGDLRSKFALAAPLALAATLACGARSGLDCSGERCTLGQAGSGGAGQAPGGEIGSAGRAPDIGGTRGNRPPAVTPPSPPVDVPSNTPGGPALPCAFDGSFDASLLVETQDDLALLEGCSEVNGDLAIVGLVTDNLAELRQLRRVSGTLQLAFAGSLEGLESLESVGNLLLEFLDTTTLAPLGNLSRIGTGTESDGALIINALTRTRSLEGLGNLQVVSSIDILDSASLQTLSGLSVPPVLRRIQLSNLPALVSITALGALQEVDELSFIGLNIETLDELPRLNVVSYLTLMNLPTLVDVRAFRGLRVVGGLHVENVGVPDLAGFEVLERVDTATVQGNENLLEIDRLSTLTSLDELSVFSNPVLQRLPEIHVEQLLSVSVQDNASLVVGPSFPLATRIEVINVSRNPLLASLIGFDALRLVGDIVITDNGALAELRMGQLQSARNVVVMCNPALPESAVTPLRGVARELNSAGNLGSISPCGDTL